MTGPFGRPGDAWTRQCPRCGKHSFPTRKEARRAARALFPYVALRAYQCGTAWHFGHTPPWIKQGRERGKR